MTTLTLTVIFALLVVAFVADVLAPKPAADKLTRRYRDG